MTYPISRVMWYEQTLPLSEWWLMTDMMRQMITDIPSSRKYEIILGRTFRWFKFKTRQETWNEGSSLWELFCLENLPLSSTIAITFKPIFLWKKNISLPKINYVNIHKIVCQKALTNWIFEEYLCSGTFCVSVNSIGIFAYKYV